MSLRPQEHRPSARCRALAGLAVLLIAHPCLCQPPAVIQLKDSDFEHQTQAATGQTTGNWCVLFTDRDHRVINVLWEKLAAARSDGDPALLYGRVGIDSNPDLAERFGIDKKTVPAARLFKDRKMYSYSGPQQASNDMRSALRKFCLSPDSPALEVPQPQSSLNKPLSKIMRDLILRVDALPGGQRFGVYGIIVAIFIVIWILTRGYFIRMPYERMDLQAKKGR